MVQAHNEDAIWLIDGYSAGKAAKDVISTMADGVPKIDWLLRDSVRAEEHFNSALSFAQTINTSLETLISESVGSSNKAQDALEKAKERIKSNYSKARSARHGAQLCQPAPAPRPPAAPPRRHP